MRLHQHTAFSITVAGILYLIFKSWGLALASLISGILVDLDHIVDVVREHGWSIKTKDFFRLCKTGQFDRIILVWHGWEWIILWAAAAWITEWNPWMTGVFIGLAHHMILDTYINATNPWSYSLIWRWKKDFHFDTIFPKYKNIKYMHR